MWLATARIGIEVEQEVLTGDPTKTICVGSDTNACRTLQLLSGVMGELHKKLNNAKQGKWYFFNDFPYFRDNTKSIENDLRIHR